MLNRINARLAGVLIGLVLVGGLVLVVKPMIAGPATATAQAAASGPNATDVAAKLEAIHLRTAARLKDEDASSHANDDAAASPALASRPIAGSISPERAVQLALQAVGGGTATRVELKHVQGATVYEVRIGQATVYVDAGTGNLVKGLNGKG